VDAALRDPEEPEWTGNNFEAGWTDGGEKVNFRSDCPSVCCRNVGVSAEEFRALDYAKAIRAFSTARAIIDSMSSAFSISLRRSRFAEVLGLFVGTPQLATPGLMEIS